MNPTFTEISNCGARPLGWRQRLEMIRFGVSPRAVAKHACQSITEPDVLRGPEHCRAVLLERVTERVKVGMAKSAGEPYGIGIILTAILLAAITAIVEAIVTYIFDKWILKQTEAPRGGYAAVLNELGRAA